jgi:hypothetical protein
VKAPGLTRRDLGLLLFPDDGGGTKDPPVATVGPGDPVSRDESRGARQPYCRIRTEEDF